MLQAGQLTDLSQVHPDLIWLNCTLYNVLIWLHCTTAGQKSFGTTFLPVLPPGCATWFLFFLPSASSYWPTCSIWSDYIVQHCTLYTVQHFLQHRSVSSASSSDLIALYNRDALYSTAGQKVLLKYFYCYIPAVIWYAKNINLYS